jgi:hypothetical protein
MKKYSYLLVIGLLFTNYNYGQSQQDSIESYKKVNKWAVVKLTIAYMEDLKGWPKKNNNSNKNDEEKTYDDLKTKYNLYSDNVNLDEVNNLLSKGWSKTRDGVFLAYKKELVDGDPLYSFDDIHFVPEKVNNIKRLETITTLNKNYNSLLPKPQQQHEIVIVKNDQPKIFLKPKETIKADNSIFKYIIQYLPLAIAILIILFLSYKLKKANKKIEDLKRRKTTLPKGLEVDNKKSSQNEIKLSENAIKSLKSQVELLQKENSNLKLQLNTKNDLVTGDSEKPKEDIKSVPIDLTNSKIKQTSIKLIYFPSPFEENRFANEDVSETEKPFSLYVAEIDKNTNRGNISLLETADLSRALNSPNTFLETVCNYENAYYSAAKAIKVIEDGQVALIGDDWVVSSKIKIKFI